MTTLSEALDTAQTELDTSIAANAPPSPAEQDDTLIMLVLVLVIVAILMSLMAFMASSKLGKKIDGIQTTNVYQPATVDEPEPVIEETENTDIE